MKTSAVQSIYNWYRATLRNPKYRWIIIGGSLLYLFSPLDISPDLFPIVGWLDDGVIIGLLVAELSQIMMDRIKGTNATSDSTEASATNAATNAAANPAGAANTQPKDATQGTTTVDVKAVDVKAVSIDD